MGYMCHHTIVVTSYDEKLLAEAHAKAEQFFAEARDAGVGRYSTEPINLVSPIVKGVTNGYATFFVAPDGSKEGWGESDAGDKARARFVKWLQSKAYDDGSSSIDYAEVQFGDEDHNTCIVNSSDDDYKAFRKTPKGQEIYGE